jgi:hypothetical protein
LSRPRYRPRVAALRAAQFNTGRVSTSTPAMPPPYRAVKTRVTAIGLPAT